MEEYRRLLYVALTRARDAVGRWAFWGLILLTTAIWISGPLSPPPPGTTAIAVVGLALWLLPVWAAWIERHRESRQPAAGSRPRGGPEGRWT